MNPSQIKNIFWDVDGVLADLNYAYFHFLTGHPLAAPVTMVIVLTAWVI